jgi:hypothetical protein
MIKQLEAMLDPDPKNRPDAQTALQSWNDLLTQLEQSQAKAQGS